MATRALLAALSLTVTLAVAEDLEWCGDNARYFPSEYTCFDDSFLCPVLFGLPNLPCGGGCYANQMYACDGGSLKLRGEQKKPFILTTASSSEHVDGLVVNACGGYLAIGTGARECAQCPADAGVDCEEYGKKCVLLPDGEMAVDLPGGQYWYISPDDGALMYTKEGNEDGLGGQGVSVFDEGFFSPGERPYWLACLRTLPGGNPGTTRSYRIYAPTAKNLARTDCDQIKLVAKSVDRKEGAYRWQ